MNIPSDIDKLVQRHATGAITRAEMGRLEAWLREDASHIEWFASYGLVEQGLLTIGRESTANDLMGALSELDAMTPAVPMVDLTDELRQRELDERSREHTKRMRLRQAGRPEPESARDFVIPQAAVWIGLAALIGVAVWVGMELTSPETAAPTDTAQAPQPEPDNTIEAPAVTYVAAVRSSVDARWAGVGGLSPTGLASDTALTLTQGLAEVVFEDGAAVIVQAPATFEPTGANGMRLVSGKITATIPDTANGFTVATPAGLVTDYGTEFGVHVNHDGQTLAQTFTGRVGLKPVGGGEEVQLRAGAARIASPSGRVREVEPDALAFVRGDEFAARQAVADGATAADPYQRWLAFSFDLRRDADVVLYYAFDRADVSGKTLRNSAGGRWARQYDATFVADPASPGRFDEKPAFGFDDDGEFVEATLDREMSAATLAGWYWIDEMAGTFASLLHTGGTGNTGGVHWHLNTNHGEGWAFEFVQNRTRHPQPSYWHDLLSTGWEPQALKGRWVHLALCYDSTAGDAVLYVDGREAQRSRLDDGVPVKLGRFRLGNWYAPKREGAYDWPRPLRGRIDEFVVIGRALTGDEVAAMYDAGRPDN